MEAPGDFPFPRTVPVENSANNRAVHPMLNAYILFNTAMFLITLGVS